ncbi:MAG: CvpA family protein [Candidatus Accumulibacter sp.]|nr:CvpA family protein [Accumulibacter sp.]
MTAFDYGVLVVMAFSALLGLWRGIIGEIIALLAWVAAFLAARAWGEPVASWLTFSTEPVVRLIATWALVFVAVLIAMALLRLAARGLIKALEMRSVDRLFGVFFGAARGALIVFVLVAVGGMTSLPKEKWWSEAYFAPALETAVLVGKVWLPSDVAKRISFG